MVCLITEIVMFSSCWRLVIEYIPFQLQSDNNQLQNGTINFKMRKCQKPKNNQLQNKNKQLQIGINNFKLRFFLVN